MRVECETNMVLTSLPFLLVTIESGYPDPNFFSLASRMRRFSLAPEMMVKSSSASWGIAGVATLDRVSVFAFIAAMITLFASKGLIGFFTFTRKASQN
jgi:hypothetical protein